jgi:hypothetical protein
MPQVAGGQWSKVESAEVRRSRRRGRRDRSEEEEVARRRTMGSRAFTLSRDRSCDRVVI